MKAMADMWHDQTQADREAYFSGLAFNSLQQAQKVFESKYGKAELNALLTGSNQQQPKKSYWPLVIGGGLVGIGIVAGLVYYFLSKKKASK